jgi:hypothetical protein
MFFWFWFQARTSACAVSAPHTCGTLAAFTANEKEEKKLKASIPALSLAMFDLRAMTDKQLRTAKLEYVGFLGKCLGSKAFLAGVRALERKSKTADAGDNEAGDAPETIAQLQVCAGHVSSRLFKPMHSFFVCEGTA